MDFIISPLIYSVIAVCCFLLSCFVMKSVPVDFSPPLWFKKLHWIGQLTVIFLFFTAVLVISLVFVTYVTRIGVIGFFALASGIVSFALFDQMFRGKTFVALACAIAVTAGWVFVPNWITLNIAAVVPVLFLLATVKIPFRYIVIGLAALFVYDVVNVFGTKVMVEMAHATIGIKLPLAFIIQSSFSFESQPISMLGVGDIAIPGLVVAHAYRTGGRIYFIATTIGYIVGMFVACAVVIFFHLAQPALLYLIPSVLIAFYIAEYYKVGFNNSVKRVS